RSALVLLLLPVGLALVAALLGQYPYGGARVLVYAVPGLVLLTAAGLPRLLVHGRAASLVTGTLLLLPGIEAGRSVVRDGGRADGEAASAWVEAQRKPSDVVCGNDWTHHYHFRHLGPLFRDRPREDADRVWVVFAGRYAPDALFELARSWLPPSYRVLKRRDFRNTTVLLAARRQR
ncbi:MAG TPA: hypothetical protein VKD72_34150, partial [Gemmataceae bacterium]|nr:hypothetical protein [Gemmataceae bacterium]